MIKETSLYKLLLVAAACSPAWAQQAIVNVPSADITPKGKNFFMHEAQVRTWGPQNFYSGTSFYCYGVGKSTEIAVTNYNLSTTAGANLATAVGFKSAPQFFKKNHDELEVKLTVGQMAVMNHRGLGLGSFSYAHGSMKLPEIETRVTFGGYGATRQLLERNAGGVLAGIEHPLFHHKVVLLGEWFSGRHDFGAAIAGVLVHLPKKQLLVAGYKFPNSGDRSKQALVFEYGVFF